MKPRTLLKLKELPQATLADIDSITPQEVLDAWLYVKETKKRRKKKTITWPGGVEYVQKHFPSDCGTPCCLLGGVFLRRGMRPPNAFGEWAERAVGIYCRNLDTSIEFKEVLLEWGNKSNAHSAAYACLTIGNEESLPYWIDRLYGEIAKEKLNEVGD